VTSLLFHYQQCCQQLDIEKGFKKVGIKKAGKAGKYGVAGNFFLQKCRFF
jgi:hypothetical protein